MALMKYVNDRIDFFMIYCSIKELDPVSLQKYVDIAHLNTHGNT